MGFGLICAGLTTLLFMRIIPAELIGFIVVSRGLRRLAGYNSFFRAALYCSYALVAFSAVDAVIWVLGSAGILPTLQWLEGVLSYLHLFLLLPFQLFLFRALQTICYELGYEKGAKRAVLALSVTAVYCVVHIITLLGIPGFGGYMMLAGLLMYIVNIVTTEMAVYTCYRAITTDEAEKREEEKIEKFQKQFSRGKKKK